MNEDEFDSLALRIEFRTTPEKAKALIAVLKSITIEQMTWAGMQPPPSKSRDGMATYKAYCATAEMCGGFIQAVEQAVYEARNSPCPGGAQ